MSEITRRGFGRLAGLTVLAAGVSAGTGSVSAAAGPGPVRASAGTGSAIAAGTAAGEPFALRHLSSFDQRRYFTYPTHNGFADADRIVLGQRETGGTSLWEVHLRTGEQRFLARFATPASDRNPFVWWNIHSGRLVTCAENAIWLIDLADPAPVKLYSPPPGRALSVVVNLHPAGDRVLCSHYPAPITAGPTKAVEIGLTDGSVKEVFSGDVMATHFQYSAHDPEWIGYALGGNILAWAVHPVHAPKGRMIWDQAAAGVPVGTHPVWNSRAATGCLAVAIGGRASGLWMVHPDDRPDRLLAPGPSGPNGAYNHCDLTADGRWAVTDTNGRNGSALGQAGAVALVDLTGVHPPRTLGPAGWGSAHPGHPHPAFSPDGRMVAYTDTEAATDRTRVVLCDSRGDWAPRPLEWQAEAEDLVVTAAGGHAETFADPQCGAGHGVLFTPATPGGALTCEFRPPQAGTRTLRLRVKRHDSRGIYRLSVNGTAVGAPLDLYSPVMTYAEPEFAQVSLRAGVNRIQLTHVGQNPDSTRNPGTCAIDRVGLRNP
ncbi:hypothetical protein [Streptomyces sp. BE147]|uniref:hypothetical protein n=1 Tax=unclassified Streptomyces TaxID=2593676 RepID=UPI002E779327|nr:hypothetical protein [Streptomyces sp. BE147]MEE1736563.1 hypothetical protein [Streptomyces sp. BE147]